jgi:predicted PurR-regulated permease PerM
MMNNEGAPNTIHSAMPEHTGQWTDQRVVLTTLGALLVGLGFWLVFRFYSVAFILFSALVLGTVIRPAVDWLYRRRVPRAAGVVLVYLALLAMLIGFILLLAPLLVEQTRAIITKLPTYYQSLRTSLAGSPSALVQQLALQLPAGSTLTLPSGGEGGLPLGALGQALGYVGLVWRMLFVGAAILALAFYWTLDGERIIRTGMLRFPADRRERWYEVIADMETKVGAYVRGVSILSLVVGVMATVAYLLIGLPSVLVLGLLAGIFEAVPVIGPILGAILPVLLALSVAPDKVIWVIVATVVIQQAEGHLLVPRVMDKAVGVSPIVTILAILAFSTLFGLPGAVLAIPLAALIQILLDYAVRQREAAELEQPAGRDRVSVLRYQTQELIQDVRAQMRYKPQNALDEEGDAIEDLVEVAALSLDGVLARAVETQGAD